ncbi:MAG: S-layer homology domain-containing protein, partial [Clostridia bacterium]|nr:S-layer homology domain-containing protein [Clostridia bacterium]
MKKIISLILSLTMLISASATVNAAYGEHEHQLMDMANLVCHYSECTICFELFNVGDHTFENGKCTVCGHYEPINPFADVASDAWYTEDVLYAVETGLINGKTKDEFRPDDNLTYAEAVKLAACMNQLYTSGDITLANGEPWYQPYADYCKENKIIRTDYSWNDNATRVGYMYIFACALPDEAYEEINNIPEDSIPDVPSSAPYADPIYKLYRAGIVTGVDADHNCNPTASIKRSEVAVIVARMMNTDKRIRFDLGTEYIEKIDDKYEVIEEEDDEINHVIAPTVDYEPQIKVPTVEGDKVVEGSYEVLPNQDYQVNIGTNTVQSKLTIHKQPEGAEYDAYGKKHELEVQVFGGKAPYTYEWYYKERRDNITIKNGDYVKDASSEALVLSVE